VAGKLHVVATPLGNLGDLSPRAVATLRRVTLVACEDTRRTARLLAAHGIDRPTVSCHRFNEASRIDSLVARLLAGEELALVSDGGTPGVADPGVRLVRAALDAGIAVSPVPGPSAVAALLSIAGLPADRFVFEGWLPHRAGERRRRLRELAAEARTIVIFEAPHRIQATLADIDTVMGDRLVVLGRELTKLHETLLRGRAAEIAGELGEAVRGEITLALAPLAGAAAGGSAAGDAPAETTARASGAAATGRDLAAERLRGAWRNALGEAAGDRRAALRRVARECGLPRAEAWRRLGEIGEID
jgi:16S rRNA (cytidine1402-2'-O)-methyltransferase